MTSDPMSRRTADLMILLCDDGVNREELKALVGSAFKDGLDYAIKHMDEVRNQRGE